MRLQTILALTDFSAQAEHGLERAAMLAATHNARLRILYGAETPSPKFVDPFARLEQRARQLARRHGVQVVAVNGVGDPVEDTLTQAADADLLVLDRRMHRALHQFWVGSTVQQLMRRSPCPVLVVQQAPGGPYERVLVAVDYTATSKPLVRYAGALAVGSSMALFHAIDSRSAEVSQAAMQAYRQEVLPHVHNRMSRLKDSFDTRRNRVGTLTGQGDVARQMVVQQESMSADLVVVGQRRRAALMDLVAGSMARRLLGHAGCDVLVCPQDFLGQASDAAARAPMRARLLA